MPRHRSPAPRRVPAPAPAPAPSARVLAVSPAAALGQAGFGASRRRLLEALKRLGPATLREAAAGLGLSRETVREHVNALAADGLVERAGTRRAGPGRPEVLYRLTARAEPLFPRRDGEVLAELAGWLLGRGLEGETELRRFFEQRARTRLAAGRRRLTGLAGRARLDEVARILSDEGYMAEVVGGSLRLAHCPILGVVGVTRIPCRAELSLVEGLLGRTLERTDYLPDGGLACAYRVGRGKR